ncbi:MAG: GNAT family N-acetyltransferase [Acetatifactor sp.]|nr:GNAT family N-acetyltransferase [Acetatifactor sp.]
MMEIRLLDLEQIRKVYKEYMVKDFPDDELKPLKMIEKSYEEGMYESYGLFEENNLCGYAYFVKIANENDRNDYIFDFFAVREDLRDKGYGTCFLELLKKRFANAGSMLGEVENPDSAADETEKKTRLRRLDFYLRNGIVDTEVEVTLFGVDYKVLEVPLVTRHSVEEVKRIYRRIYRTILPAQMYEKRVEIK